MSPERKKLIQIFLGAQFFLAIGALIGQINFHRTEGSGRDTEYFAPYLIGFAIALSVFPFFPAYKKADFKGTGESFVPICFFLGILILPILVIVAYGPLFETVPRPGSVNEIQSLHSEQFYFSSVKPNPARLKDTVRYSFRENRNKDYAEYKHHFDYDGVLPLVAVDDSTHQLFFCREDVRVKKGELSQEYISNVSDSLRSACRAKLLRYPFDSIQYFEKIPRPDFYKDTKATVFVKASLESYWSDEWPGLVALSCIFLVMFYLFWTSVRFGDGEWDGD